MFMFLPVNMNRLKLAIQVFVSPLRASRLIDNNDLKNQFELLEKINDFHSTVFNDDITRENFNYIKFFETVTLNKQVNLLIKEIAN